VFKVLRHKTIDNLFGVIDHQNICVQNIPELFWVNETTETLLKYLDPDIPEPFKDFDLVTIKFIYEESI
jgi:hypothetical protein